MSEEKVVRLRNTETGAVVTVRESKAGRLAGFAAVTGGTSRSSSASAYQGMKVDELKAEIDRRNTDRAPDGDTFLSSDGKKPDLVAALEADDARASGTS